jgi:hypothetical protein
MGKVNIAVFMGVHSIRTEISVGVSTGNVTLRWWFIGSVPLATNCRN